MGRHEVEVHQDRVRRRELVGGGGIRHGGGIFHGGGDCAGDDCDGGGGGCGLDLCLLGFGSGEQYVRVCGVCAGVTGVVACL